MARLQYLVIISVLLHSWLTRGFPREFIQDGIKIVTYGEPCYSPQYLSVKIEEPVQVEPEFNGQPESTVACLSHQPLKLNYQAVSYEPPIIFNQPQKEYPISVDVPKVPVYPEAVAGLTEPDPLRGKIYGYNIQTQPQIKSPRITQATYNFDVQVPPPSSYPSTSTPTEEQPITLLTGLTSRIDRMLVPACDIPFSSCSCRE